MTGTTHLLTGRKIERQELKTAEFPSSKLIRTMTSSLFLFHAMSTNKNTRYGPLGARIYGYGVGGGERGVLEEEFFLESYIFL